MLDNLFTFPIIMLDGDNEEKKHDLHQRLGDIPGLSNEIEADLIRGEAECPYNDFIAISDRWLPTTDSLNKAISGKFEACFVVFGSSGSFVVPWPKAKFKKELAKFIETRPKESYLGPTITIIDKQGSSEHDLVLGGEDEE